MTPVFRFAPSPNGELHLGHALSALIVSRQAEREGGRFLLRIEDIDLARCREAFVEGIFEDLAWLGIRYETPVLRQSGHFPRYQVLAQKLKDMGILYPCFATRSEIEAAVSASGGATDPDGAPLYPGIHRNLPAAEIDARLQSGQPFALRIDMNRALDITRQRLAGRPFGWRDIDPETGREAWHEANPALWGDAVIVRKDVPASYHLAVVADDAFQGVTHITRGLDLFAATHLHRLLQVLLDLPEPVYCHHRLLTDGEGRKLSKSAADTSLKSLRLAGMTPDGIRASAGMA